MPDTYVACAMSSLRPDEYETFRHTILAVCDSIRDTGRMPYSEPFEVRGEDFDSPAEALRKNIAVLEVATMFVLVYTIKEASSSLIELGYAMKRNIPIVVFAKNDVGLPFYLREASMTPGFNIRVITFYDVNEIPTRVAEVFSATH